MTNCDFVKMRDEMLSNYGELMYNWPMTHMMQEFESGQEEI